jgi:hypothetical protein
MNEPEVRLAIRVPSSLIQEIDNAPVDPKHDFKVERSVPAIPEPEESLGFDPITGTAIVWVALKFIGKAAVSGAVSLITKIVYDRMKASAQKGQRYEITIRFPTGESVTVLTCSPESAQS